jgi:DNA-binding response OmpR family regulator
MPAHSAARGDSVQPSRPPPSAGLTVLCVDDQAEDLLIRKTLLEQAGYVVLTADNSEGALKIFEANWIDVVVSDHLLRDTKGTEMARLMKLAKPEVPILLLSGVVDSPAGIEHTDKFIEKTEGPEKLLEAITALTSKSMPTGSGVPFLVRKSRSAAPEGGDKRAATMAHEINNPLESLLNLLYLADAEPAVTENGHRFLALAREEVSRISQIAHAVLQGGRDDRAEKIDVPQLLRAVVDFYRSRLDSRGISVDVRCCAGGNLAVYPGPLRQVFSNLLLNAADAMPKGGRLQTRIAKAREWSGQHRCGLRVTFADSGSGIRVQNLQQIFEPFFTTKGAGGSGLGLSLVQDVVQKHGGSVRVRSSTKPGHSGSVFAIFLPRRERMELVRPFQADAAG